jgi:signal peptidase I
MDFDFSAFLVLATFVTGLIWAVDALFFAKQRTAADAGLPSELVAGGDGENAGLSNARKEPILVEYSRSFFPIILIVLVLRSFIFEPFRIPSGSMMPTLLAGDFILVKKYAYGLRLPVLHKKIVNWADPERGDVVVFRYPVEPKVDYIKRIVGMPGDRISYRNKTVFVNGTPVVQADKGVYLAEGVAAVMNGAKLNSEKLGEIEHDILLQQQDFGRFYPCLRGGAYTVPEAHYFVMGDNRDNSNDSRFWCSVPDENLLGKAVVIWMSWDGGMVWDRLGNIIE